MKKLTLTLCVFATWAETLFGQGGTFITPMCTVPMDGGVMVSAGIAPADATTYFFGWGESITIGAHATIGNAQMTVDTTGTITQITWMVSMVTNGSNEAVSHYLRLNNTTDTTLSTSETYDPGANQAKTFTYANLSIPVVAGNTIAFKIVCPTWATNPTFNSAHLRIKIETR